MAQFRKLSREEVQADDLTERVSSATRATQAEMVVMVELYNGGQLRQGHSSGEGTLLDRQGQVVRQVPRAVIVSLQEKERLHRAAVKRDYTLWMARPGGKAN